ncbi:MAG TPA: Panacea domain-containing protein [Thermoanaerobaculia bacterium]|nr:Panacea domain-containing protein [Thermoanaerobaculia bacterium]
MSKTKAVKLPYLVDVLAGHYLGRPVSDATYQTWELGVVGRELYAFTTYGEPNAKFNFREHSFSESGRLIEVKEAPAELPLEPGEVEIVDWVAKHYGSLDATRLGLLTKSLNTHLGEGAWGSNQPAEMGEDAFARLSSGWFRFFEALPALDLSDPAKLKPVGDPREHLRSRLLA